MITSEFEKLLGDRDPFAEFEFEVQSVVLPTGATMIAGIAPLNETHYLLMLPMLIRTVTSENNMTKTLIPYNTGSQEIFMPFRKEHVVCSGYPEKNLLEFYNKTTEEIMDEASEEIEEEEVQQVKAALGKRLH